MYICHTQSAVTIASLTDKLATEEQQRQQAIDAAVAQANAEAKRTNDIAMAALQV